MTKDSTASSSSRSWSQPDLADDDSPAASHVDPERVLEELRIHQAELEAQNRELLDTRQRLESERSHYRILFQHLPLPAMVLDRMAVIAEVNRAAVDFFGFSGARALHRHSFLRMLPDHGGAWFGDAMAQAESGGVFEVDGVGLIDSAGNTIPVDLRLVRMGDDYHLDQHTLVLAVDRRRQQAHEADRRLYRTLLDNSPALVSAYDRDGRCILINAEAAKAMGADSRKAIGRRRAELMNNDQATFENRRDDLVWREGKALHETLQWPPSGPHSRSYAVTRFPLRDADHQIFAIATISTDITDLESMRQRLNLAMQIFSQGSEGILIVDDKRRMIFANAAFEAMVGVREAELLGREPDFLEPGRHESGFGRKILERLLESGMWEGEIWARRRNGEVFPCWLRLSAVRGSDGRVSHFIGLANDITQRKSAEQEIERLAYFDSLTGTPNRYLLKDRVGQAMRASKRSGNKFGLLFLDLDRFKEINDAFGHEMGDRLLIEFSRRLRRLLREHDTVCRLGGDEFVLLVNDICAEQAAERAVQVLEAATLPFDIEGHRLQVSASIGLAMFPDDGEDYDQLLKNADTAMYQAKSDGRNNFRFFNEDMARAVSQRAHMEAALREALDTDQLSMVFQPQLAIDDGRLIGVEALLRWQHPELGQVSPAEFIPLAEGAGLIVRLGNRVLDEVLAQMWAWRDGPLDNVSVSVNVSADQFWRQDFFDTVTACLTKHAVPPRLLWLELTEHTAMRMPVEAASIMRRLSEQGVGLAIDDFGTGYSSLAHLQHFPVRFLKIDRGFVADIDGGEGRGQVCRAILQIAQTLGLDTIAEGVETQSQLDFLKRHGCQHAQGFMLARPMPAAELLEWVVRRSTQAE